MYDFLSIRGSRSNVHTFARATSPIPQRQMRQFTESRRCIPAADELSINIRVDCWPFSLQISIYSAAERQKRINQSSNEALHPALPINTAPTTKLDKWHLHQLMTTLFIAEDLKFLPQPVDRKSWNVVCE